MFRYSKLIGLVFVSVITLTIFYIQNETLSKSFTSFNINTVEGDDAMKDEMVIKGDAFTIYGSEESFTITKDGTKYVRDESIIGRSNYYVPEKVKQLRQEHRNFMRMKDDDAPSYIKEGDTLIYANVPYTRWGVLKGKVTIETYDTITNERNKYEIDAPSVLEHAFVDEMVVGEDQLYIVVSSMAYDMETDKEKMQINVFTYDLAKETAGEDYEVVIEGTEEYRDFTNVFFNDETNPTEAIITGTTIDYEDLPSSTEEVTEEEIEVAQLKTMKKIDLQTGDLSEINVKPIKENSIPVAYNGEEIIFAHINDTELVYEAYHIATEKITETFSVKVDSSFISLWDIEDNFVKHNKVYTLIDNTDESTATLIVIDSENMKLDYKGVIEGKPNEQTAKGEVETYFHTLEIVD